MKLGLSNFLSSPPVILILFSLINFLSADPPLAAKDGAAFMRVDHFLPNDWKKKDGHLLRSIRPFGGKPELTTIKNHPTLPPVPKRKYRLPLWGDQDELFQIISQRDTSFQKLIDNVATGKKMNINLPTSPKIHKNPQLSPLLQNMRDLNLAMRVHYKSFMDVVGNNIYPLIIASDNEPGFAGVGSSYKLFLEDGTVKHIAPVPPSYERNKAWSHITLTLFTILSPYFNNPTQLNGTDLKNYLSKLEGALESVQNSGRHELEYLEKERGIRMISLAIVYVQKCLSSNEATYTDFIAYADNVVPLIDEAMKLAAKTQVDYVYPALEKWKNELGPELWSNLYVLIPTVFPVSGINPRQQIFEKLMDPNKIKTNIIKVENSQGEEFSRQTLGRVVGDRSMAHLVFGANTPSRIDHLLSLSTRRNLVSTECSHSLQDYLSKSG